MTIKMTTCAAMLLVVFGARPATSQQLSEMDAKLKQQFARTLAPELAKIEAPQVKMEPDLAHAVGLHRQREGVFLVPQKGLSGADPGEAVKAETGAGLAYLFMSQSFTPVVNGQPADDSKLRALKVTAPQGNELSIRCLLLAVRRLADDDWRLYVYGTDEKPLIEAKFDEAAAEKEGPVAIRVEDVQDYEGTLVVTVLGKWEAGFRVRYSGY